MSSTNLLSLDRAPTSSSLTSESSVLEASRSALALSSAVVRSVTSTPEPATPASLSVASSKARVLFFSMRTRFCTIVLCLVVAFSFSSARATSNFFFSASSKPSNFFFSSSSKLSNFTFSDANSSSNLHFSEESLFSSSEI